MAEPDLPDDPAAMAEAVAMRPYRDRATMAVMKRTVMAFREEAGAGAWPIVMAKVAPVMATGIGMAVTSCGPVTPAVVGRRGAIDMHRGVTAAMVPVTPVGLGRRAQGKGSQRDAESGGGLADLPASDRRVRHRFSPILVTRGTPRAVCLVFLRAGIGAGNSLRISMYN